MTVYDDPHAHAPADDDAGHYAPVPPGRPIDEASDLGGRAAGLATALLVGGLACLAVGLALAFVLGWFVLPRHSPFGGLAYALNSYLLGWVFALTIPLGALFFVLLQHLFRAGWSVNVRRVPEALAACLPTMGLLGIPVVLSVLLGVGTPYIWAQWVSGPVDHETGLDTDTPTASVSLDLSDETEALTSPEPQAEHAAVSTTVGGATPEAAEHGGASHGYKEIDALTWSKRAFLNPLFFTLRFALYLLFFAFAGRFFWTLSVRQDHDGDPAKTRSMEKFAAPGLLLFGLLTTFFAYDVVMSLDPHWYSTVFGVYLWVGAAVGGFATIILSLNLLQRYGLLGRSVTTEHYHDLGKFLFAATFFWGYIAFSQYMLLWYANIPETTGWLSRRGATTVPEAMGGWTWVAAALLVGHLLIPFAGLLSRHVKRNKGLLTFWAVWMLIFHWVDLWWLVMPEMEEGFVPLLPELLVAAGLLGVLGWRFLTVLDSASLRPLRDPRRDESFAFTNI